MGVGVSLLTACLLTEVGVILQEWVSESNNMQRELLPLSRLSKEFNVSIARSFSISRLKNTTDCSPIESP
jgi:hypothetical protein